MSPKMTRRAFIKGTAAGGAACLLGSATPCSASFRNGIGAAVGEETPDTVYHRLAIRRQPILVGLCKGHAVTINGMWMRLQNGSGNLAPRKHTVNIRPSEKLCVDVDADAFGNWAFHCHILYHMHTGMFRVVAGMLKAGRTTIAVLAAFLMVFLMPVSFLAEAGNAGKVSADQKSASCNTYPVAPLPPMHYGRFLLDRMEYTLTGQEDKTVSYEATGWFGGDYQRLWLELEGTHDTGSADGGEVERLDILHGRLVSPFWNIRAGMGYRGTIGPDSDERFFAVFGLKGIAPYGFEIDTNFRISNRGEVLLDLEAEYDVYLAQRIVLQPRLDASFSFNRMEGLGIGPGFPGLDLSARLRYEIRREIAPYIGIRWSTMTGGSRDISRQEEEPSDVTSFIAGLRLWF